MIVLQIFSLILWLGIIPFGIGLLPIRLMKESDRTPGVIWLSGYFVLFALFEFIGIPIVIWMVYHSFAMLCRIFAIACALLSLLGVFLSIRIAKKNHTTWKGIEGIKNKIAEVGMEEKLYYVLFFLLMAFQMYMAFTRASFDGDDAYYGVQGVIAQQRDSLYRFNPYTGRSAPLDVRHALALMPIWEAFVGKMSGVHATIVAHSVIPLVMIPLVYSMYYQIGKKLLSDKKNMLPIFMVVMALLQMFGNVSIYTNETFFLTRTWQGKTVTGSLILPAVFWIFLCLFEKDKKEKDEKEIGYWLLLAFINLAAGLSSSLAVLLSALLVAGLAVLFAIKNKSFMILIKAGLTCIPSAAYVLTYLLISR